MSSIPVHSVEGLLVYLIAVNFNNNSTVVEQRPVGVLSGELLQNTLEMRSALKRRLEIPQNPKTQ